VIVDVVVASTDEAWRRTVVVALVQRGLVVQEVPSGTAHDAVTSAILGRARVVLVAADVPGNHVQAVADAVSTDQSLRVILMGQADDQEAVLVALASGASGYLEPCSSPQMLAGAVKAVIGGRLVLPDGLTPAILDVLRRCGRGVVVQASDGSPAELTQREWEIYVLLRQGRSTAEIAERFVVSKVTVRGHVSTLLRKLGHTNRHAVAANGVCV
jgi:DNA-binding NarL/FixJ family response regulator